MISITKNLGGKEIRGPEPHVEKIIRELIAAARPLERQIADIQKRLSREDAKRAKTTDQGGEGGEGGVATDKEGAQEIEDLRKKIVALITIDIFICKINTVYYGVVLDGEPDRVLLIDENHLNEVDWMEEMKVEEACGRARPLSISEIIWMEAGILVKVKNSMSLK